MSGLFDVEQEESSQGKQERPDTHYLQTAYLLGPPTDPTTPVFGTSHYLVRKLYSTIKRKKYLMT